MNQDASRCATCYGTGELVTEQGPIVCPDCFGDGRALPRGAKVEWRLRELGHRYSDGSEAGADVQWLIHQARRGREALIHILTLCQDADEHDELAQRIKHEVNEALEIYAEETDSK